MPQKLTAANPALAGSGWQITLSQSCTAVSCGPCQHRFPRLVARVEQLRRARRAQPAPAPHSQRVHARDRAAGLGHHPILPDPGPARLAPSRLGALALNVEAELHDAAVEHLQWLSDGRLPNIDMADSHLPCP